VPVRAPVDGKVLRVLHESAGIVAAGDPLVELVHPARERIDDQQAAEKHDNDKPAGGQADAACELGQRVMSRLAAIADRDLIVMAHILILIL